MSDAAAPALLAQIKKRIKTLAAQGQMLRVLEWKAADAAARHQFHQDRVVRVRSEQRAMLLLYGYLRGKPYLSIEPVAQPGYRNNAFLQFTHAQFYLEKRGIEVPDGLLTVHDCTRWAPPLWMQQEKEA